MISIKRAIVSVSSKDGLIPLCKALKERNVEILSTSNTHAHLKQNGIPSIPISDYTGFPELIHGRVKTLHPKIFAGILARDSKNEGEEIKKFDIGKIDLVCVNLYPFEKVSEMTEKPELWQDEIDIGGVSLLRASAKNYQECVTLSDPSFYEGFLKELNQGKGTISEEFSLAMMQQTYLKTGQYDLAIAKKFMKVSDKDIAFQVYQKAYDLRYGENPHQSGGYWNPVSDSSGLIMGCEKLHGKELSYNNILDTALGLDLVDEFENPATVIVKHNNPCGVCENQDFNESYKVAYECDSVSAYGGVFLFNREVTKEIASHIHTIFAEIICAPSFSPEALQILQEKKNIRLLKRSHPSFPVTEIRSAGSGVLMQEKDKKLVSEMTVKWGRDLTDQELADVYFGIKIVKHVKSNAIVVVKNQTTMGLCGGQPNRINSTIMSLKQAGEKAKGAVLVSDAYFPFPDSIQEAIKAEIKIVVEPGGSIRDNEIIDEAKKHDIILVFTGLRHFLH
jgi:phosphoribosylaminoimidazolecarboxamide formyltransferase/IMP cyclohydrolase